MASTTVKGDKKTLMEGTSFIYLHTAGQVVFVGGQLSGWAMLSRALAALSHSPVVVECRMGDVNVHNHINGRSQHCLCCVYDERRR